MRHAGPFVLLAAAVLYLRAHWAELPDRFPVHWGWNGQPDRWSGKSVGAAFLPLAIAAVVVVIIALLSAVARHSARPAAPGLAERRFRRTVAGLLAVAEYQVALTAIWVSLFPLVATSSGPLRTSPPPVLGAVLLLSLVFVLLLAGILTSLGHGGRPVPASSADGGWKSAGLYHDPSDPALFIARRSGRGYTLNFAHPSAWVVMALALAIPIVLVWLAL